MQIIEKIISNFINSKSLYIGEKVTMSEHMIQTAMLAEKAKCNDELICSCLLHDYGHFILENPDELVKLDVDGEHENIGYEYLKNFFKKEIVEPIRYHVLAKRYLAKDKKYFNLLSEASKTSLRLQGGILNEEKCSKFETQEYFKSSILLRKFDEAAKKTDIEMKSIHDYQKLLTSKLI
ncbi:HD domain-containing protein [Candidatus Pelagibacter sp.]|jgi:predicted HD phosphohydrolase|nr:HD domain-containing protein [Candidatus Pelagibacter sp.]|tara:strand:+ start:450 stop:986 length:537 start_codon:yes stop_codon:yes gene_type:complete